MTRALHLWWVEHHGYTDLVIAPDAATAIALAVAEPDNYGEASEYAAEDVGAVDVARFVAHIT